MATTTFVDKLAYAPSAGRHSLKHLLPYEAAHGGDIIVFRYPPNLPSDTFVKRLIGNPGDHIKLANKPFVYRERQQCSTSRTPIKNTADIDPYRDNFPWP